MCTRYITPQQADVERHWHVGARDPAPWGRELYPGYAGVFIRPAPQQAEGERERELVVGQWNLIPHFAEQRKLKYPTANARSEELTNKASYRQPWARGQRCIIPAAAFYEPCWESGRHQPWKFSRADGTPWGLAGLWNRWTDPVSGEPVESYTLLTINADAHPLMRRMHKPDPRLAADAQDKRSVIPIEVADVDGWLFAPVSQATQWLRLAPVEVFEGEPEGGLPPSLF